MEDYHLRVEENFKDKIIAKTRALYEENIVRNALSRKRKTSR